MRDGLVLLVEAELALQRHLTSLLRTWGHDRVLTAASVDEAMTALTHNGFLFTILDLDLNGAGGEGMEFFRRLEIQGGSPGPIIVLSGETTVERTTEAGALGCEDFIQKPFLPEDLENAIKEALARPRRAATPSAEGPAARLRQEVSLWRSPKMREVWEIVQQAAVVDVTVLIRGETGVGKDVVARSVHHFSSRQGQPFVTVNCAAVPRELLESELFGHERGAFTGAHQLKIGRFEAANHGTVFLDEIGDLHPALQAKLLHVLQDGTFSRVGGRSTIKVDVRVLAATNQDLERAVADGRFREDLYYRLNVIQVEVPPLRERPEEIPLLAEYFVRRYSRLFNRNGFVLDPQALARLRQHRFPGNVRELENIVKRMIVLGDPLLARTLLGPGKVGNGDSVAVREPAAPPPVLSLKDVARAAARAAEREAMARVLDQTGWNRVRAAKLLKISYRALLYKIKDVGLDPERSGPRPGIVGRENV